MGTLDEVIRVVAHGRRLFPVRARDKTPLIRQWQQQASSDASAIRNWAVDHPSCNWGMATGPGSGVWALDVDGEKGRVSLAALELEHGTLPVTLTSRTGRGEHRFFTWQVGCNIRNSASKLAQGLDVRGEGGYVVIPPSVHPSGTDYQWANPDAPIADAPHWLLAKLTTPAQRPARTAAAEIGILPEGTRNDGLTRRAGALRRKGAMLAQIETELLTANARRCKPPLSDSEVLKIAASVAKYPVGGPDPLECAWQLTQRESYQSLYERFVGLCRSLQTARRDLPIALPLKRIGGLMGCDWTQARRWRKRAENEGLLQLFAPYVPHRRAAQYFFNECPTSVVRHTDELLLR